MKEAPGRLARPAKRHYTFAVAASLDWEGWRPARRSSAQSIDYPVVFAPFVYRLGRHPFTVERAVRFR